ncbi:hypothetical protein DFH53_002005 [Clostridium beijerinckii]|nr:hypothetical protein [Clostridium beijerinckii]
MLYRQALRLSSHLGVTFVSLFRTKISLSFSAAFIPRLQPFGKPKFSSFKMSLISVCSLSHSLVPSLELLSTMIIS